MFILAGNPLALDAPFTVDDVNYGSDWLRRASPAEREAIGITEVDDPPVVMPPAPARVDQTIDDMNLGETIVEMLS